MSQRELASPGVSYAYISRIEAGARRPSVKALRMLGRKLGVSADYLETGSEIRDVDERELRIADAELELRLGGDPAQAEGDVGAGGRHRVTGRDRLLLQPLELRLGVVGGLDEPELELGVRNLELAFLDVADLGARLEVIGRDPELLRKHPQRLDGRAPRASLDSGDVRIADAGR